MFLYAFSCLDKTNKIVKIILILLLALVLLLLALWTHNPVIIILLILIIPSLLYFSSLGYHYASAQTGQEWLDGSRQTLENVFGLQYEGFNPQMTLLGGKPAFYMVNHTIESTVDVVSAFHVCPGKYKIVSAIHWWRVLGLTGQIKVEGYGTGQYQRIKDEIQESLRDGFSIIVFPEGKYSGLKQNWERLEEVSSGMFRIAKELGVPIIPTIISGSSQRFGFHLPTPITISYLAPLDPVEYEVEDLMKIYLERMNDRLERYIP